MTTLSNRGARRAIVKNAEQLQAHQQGIALVARDMQKTFQRLDALEAWAEELSRLSTFRQRLLWLLTGAMPATWTKPAQPRKREVID